MRLSRLSVTLVALVLAAAIGPTAAAHAQSNPPGYPPAYPPAHPVITVSDGTIVVGESVEVTGAGFAPGETITYVIHCDSHGTEGGASWPDGGTVVADQNGGFHQRLTLNRPCNATITYTGAVSGLSGSVTVLVVSSRDELPTTGTDSTSYLGIGFTGLGIVLVGSLLLALTIRRRRGHARLGG
jgi:hypothetical protein